MTRPVGMNEAARRAWETCDVLQIYYDLEHETWVVLNPEAIDPPQQYRAKDLQGALELWFERFGEGHPEWERP